MDYILFEKGAFNELKALVGQLLDRVSRYRELTSPAAHPR